MVVKRQWWLFIVWIVVCVVTLFVIGQARAEERIYKAEISPAGLLILSFKVQGGVISEAYRIVLSIREPTTCKVSDPRYVLYTQDALLIDPTPLKMKRKICPDYNFAKGKCRGIKGTK